MVARHFAAVVLDQLAAAGLDVPGFVAEKTGALDEPFDARQRSGGQGGGRRVAFEKLRRDQIHPHVGALGREDRGHQQLQGVRMVEHAEGVGIGSRSRWAICVARRFNEAVATIRGPRSASEAKSSRATQEANSQRPQECCQGSAGEGSGTVEARRHTECAFVRSSTLRVRRRTKNLENATTDLATVPMRSSLVRAAWDGPAWQSGPTLRMARLGPHAYNFLLRFRRVSADRPNRAQLPYIDMTTPMDEAGYDPLYLEGIEHFNVCDFYESHEVWEALWTEYRGRFAKVLPGADPGGGRLISFRQRQHSRGEEVVHQHPRLLGAVSAAASGFGRG